MKRVILGILIFTALTADAAQAQTWRHVPKVVVVSPADDSRLQAVNEAVAYWNSTLQEMGSGFRLGPVVRMVRPIPEEALQQLSTSVLGNRGRTADFPGALRDLPGDITDLPHRVRVRVVRQPVQRERQTDCRHPRDKLPAHEPSERPAKCDRARAWPCDRPAAQQRPHDIDVRPAVALPARSVSLRSTAHVSADRGRKELVVGDVSIAMEIAISRAWALYEADRLNVTQHGERVAGTLERIAGLGYVRHHAAFERLD
jgi:hypothetical protein